MRTRCFARLVVVSMLFGACSSAATSTNATLTSSRPDASTSSAGTRVYGLPEGEAVANSLWLAWSRGNRDGAETLATIEVVDILWARPPKPTEIWTTPTKCQRSTERTDLVVCRWETDSERLVVEVADPPINKAVAVRFEPT